MNDERDPRDTRPEADDTSEAGDAPEVDAEEATTASPAEPAEEFESQPSTTPHDPDATAEWPASDQVETAPAPPPGEAESDALEPATPEHEPWPAEPAPSDVEAYASQPAPAADEDSAGSAAHTVPATDVGESTLCPRCGTENRPGLAFCRNCGQRLMAAGTAPVERPGTPEGTQACPRCGTHNRAGTAFCQNCGANLRVTPTSGYVPPAVAGQAPADEATVAEERTHAILGPIVLLIAAIGMATAWLLPFPYGVGSLFERAAGTGGYGIGFWSGYPDVIGGIADQAYFGFGAAVPLLVLLLVVLVIAGIVRARPGMLQSIGLAIALIWAVGLAVLFVVVEMLGGSGSDLAGMLRDLTPGGIIFFLASLIAIIGTLTRFARG
jgi:hypothetical protein